MASCYRVGTEVVRQQYWSNGVGPAYDNQGLCGFREESQAKATDPKMLPSTCPWAGDDAPSVSNLAHKSHRGPLNLPTKRHAPKNAQDGQAWNVITQRAANIPNVDADHKGLGAGSCRPVVGGIPFAIGDNLAAGVPIGRELPQKRVATKEKDVFTDKPTAVQHSSAAYTENFNNAVFGRKTDFMSKNNVAPIDG